MRKPSVLRELRYTMEDGGVAESVHGECGYCEERVGEGGELWMPLECNSCHQLFHIRCLKGRRPPVLRGDKLWLFTCSFCHSLHKETWSRPHLQWVHVIHLVLYHLMVTQKGKDGYFRWNEDICGCIQRHWQALMPHRRRTQSWHSTVAGTLSVHCPSLFQSGAKKLGESGYWTLTSLTPPDPIPAMKAGSKGVKSSIEGESKRVSILDSPVVMEVDSPPSPPSPSPSSPIQPTFTSLHSSLCPISSRQEALLLAHLEKASFAIGYSPKASRLKRKLKMRQCQRNHGYPTFDIDRHITHSLSTTVKYVINEEKPYSDQIVSIVRQVHPPSLHPSPHPYHTVLHHISSFPLLSASSPSPSPRLTTYLSGRSQALVSISSPYTARLLKPYIFRSKEICPPQVRLLQDIVGHFRRTCTESGHTPYIPHSIDLCYLQRSHVSACNGLLAHFFWPVDISDSLNCPDFTCVALYGRLVIGCAFMTPDVKVGEAYISFLLVHPQFSGAGLGKMMLYHLIQSCQGKDVTLHVSVDNPAMLLYQSFGFKAEQYCLDFYDRYYPPSHPHSRHAYFMRLHR